MTFEERWFWVRRSEEERVVVVRGGPLPTRTAARQADAERAQRASVPTTTGSVFRTGPATFFLFARSLARWLLLLR